MVARVVCESCKEEIDDLALRCPLCGARTKEGHAFLKERASKQKAKNLGFLILFGAVAWASWMIYSMLSERMGSTPDPPPGLPSIDQPPPP